MRKIIRPIILVPSFLVLLLVFQSLRQEDNQFAGTVSFDSEGQGRLETQGTVRLDAVTRSVDNLESSGQSWRDVEGFTEEFHQRFLMEFINNGGEEKQIQFILDRTEQMKELGDWDGVKAAIGNAKAAGMAMDVNANYIYSDLLMPEYYAVGNLLHAQRAEYLAWQSEVANGHVHLREREMELYPLNYPPEVHFATIGKHPSGWDYSSELLEHASRIRETAIREYSRYVLEEFVMLQSVRVALMGTEVAVSPGEKEELMEASLPTYRNIHDAIEEVERGYAKDLADLLASYSVEIPEMP